MHKLFFLLVLFAFVASGVHASEWIVRVTPQSLHEWTVVGAEAGALAQEPAKRGQTLGFGVASALRTAVTRASASASFLSTRDCLFPDFQLSTFNSAGGETFAYAYTANAQLIESVANTSKSRQKGSDLGVWGCFSSQNRRHAGVRLRVFF